MPWSEQLRTNIWDALYVLKPYQKRTLGLDINRIRNEVTDDLVQRIMGGLESETLMLRPDLVGPPHAPRISRIEEPMRSAEAGATWQADFR